MSAAPDQISIRGAREHNLRNLDLCIPRDALVVVTGPSGSGKSSLAFDTLYAEGQRRYVESLSTYARQFLDQLQRPDVESIDGLSPAIAIEQRTAGRSPRSTVGTITEIHDYLRLLWARVGRPHCWVCGLPIARQSVEQMTERLLQLGDGARVTVLAPVVRGRKGEYRKELDVFRRQGFVRVRIDGAMHDLSDEIRLAKTRKHDIDLVIDRIAVKESARGRIAESLATALRLGAGLARVDAATGEGWLFSESNACPSCGLSFPEIAPRTFSFNAPQGACPSCDGLGTREELDPALVVSDPDLTLARGAIAPWGGPRVPRYYAQILASLARHFDSSTNLPWRELPAAARRGILHGTGSDEVSLRFERAGRSEIVRRPWEGALAEIEQRRAAALEDGEPDPVARFCSPRPCLDCGGARLRIEARSVRLGGDGAGEELTLPQLVALPLSKARIFLESLVLAPTARTVADRVLHEIRERLRFLEDVGLGYLTLDRPAATLSGGEAQRIRLATQVGSSLMGVLYVLDEPSIGLHPRDNARLLESLARLRDLGNSVVVVEHDEATIRAADWVVDMGPGAGVHGGEVVSAGPPAEIARDEQSPTGPWLAGRRRIELPRERRLPAERWLVLHGCREHNLKDVTLRLPLGLFVVVTGVSGSGKSTLINDTLQRVLAQRLHGASEPPGRFAKLDGMEHVDKVVDVSQAPIGRSPRSNPATYTGIFDGIRQLFSQVPEARVRGFGPGRFSFNVKGGRCEACQGDGQMRIEMQFLPDHFVTCEICAGRRYGRETLEVTYRGKSIADVLEMTVEEALAFFEPIESLRRPLQTLHDVGLDYLALGQAATTLSGGEAQRIKLARELSRRSTGRTLYLLDEPTTGLHFADVARLLEVLDRLVSLGNTVVVIEHHLDVIKRADHVIDLGPEGGDAGGSIVAAGTPEAIAHVAASHTGRALLAVLAR